jgi:hypothetical protein
MICRPVTTRTVLAGSMGGLVLLVALGGVLLARTEGVGYAGGVWMSFCAASTVGFGGGPLSSLGRLIAGLEFAFAAVCWFGVVVAAVETGIDRFRYHALFEDALRTLPSRRRPSLFGPN